MPANDLEVFTHFTENEDTDLELDYLSYAIFARRKWHWVERFDQLNGRQPSQSDVDTWIQQLSVYDLNTMRVEAADFFHDAATRYMTNEISKARIEGKDDAIAASIKSIRDDMAYLARFRNQLLIALMTGIITPIMLGAFLFCLSEFEVLMPSPLHMFEGQRPTTPPIALPASPIPTR